jgi:TonB family protein
MNMIKKIAFVTLSLLVCQVALAQDSNTTDSWWEEAATTHDEYNNEGTVEQMPSFPGGGAALRSFFINNLKYPKEAEKNGVQGRVLCSFIVERDGSITDVRVIRGVDQSIDKEAVRVLGAMPKWIPGRKDGIPIRVNYTVTVTFKLP